MLTRVQKYIQLGPTSGFAAQPTFNPRNRVTPIQWRLSSDCTGSRAALEKNRHRLVMAGSTH
jgi:hypothetical protein